MKIFIDEFGKEHIKVREEQVIWRPGVYAIVEKDEKILLVQPPRKETWELPGGGMETGETIEQAVQREFYEETGYKVEISDPRPLYIGEKYFYSTTEKQYYHSLVIIVSAKLLSDAQNKEVINSIKKDEIEKVEWVDRKDITEQACHYAFWPYFKNVK